MKHRLTVASFLLLIGLAVPDLGFAYNWWYDMVESDYPLTERTSSCLVCHTSTGSAKVNPYGWSFRASGGTAEALGRIARKDADGDGFPNEAELRTGHFPGDPLDYPTPEELEALEKGEPIPPDIRRDLYETLQCPCCDKLVARCGCTMVPEIRRIVREGLAAGKGAAEIKEELVAKYGRAVLPLGERMETLPPEQFSSVRVSRAYRVAESIPEELSKYPCFCACYRLNAHQTLLDCYKNTHAEHCQVCMDEAFLIQDMVRRGIGDAAIRACLVREFGAVWKGR